MKLVLLVPGVQKLM
uniref:Uncharacterized protein n=1 Tax=Arundo donax TaxID=35708 RepID=A0A0A9A5Q6_ARUDO